MVENNEKMQLLYFRDTRIRPVADIPASQVRHPTIMHHFSHKATLILGLRVLWTLSFNVMPLFLKVGL